MAKDKYLHVSAVELLPKKFKNATKEQLTARKIIEKFMFLILHAFYLAGCDQNAGFCDAFCIQS